MPVRLKPVEDQVIVITGASSGIGLATARMAGRRGARLVLAARDENALREVEADIRRDGGRAVFVVADVADEDAMNELAGTALREFGGFDTWVNNAGTSIYGKAEDTSMEDQRQLFETNYWGTVIGSRIAAARFRRHGGALVNVGSVLGDRAVPLQATYCATKHAVKGFTNALRMELEAEGAPVSVTLIKPAAVDTQLEEHAKTLMGSEPLNPPPVYAPEVVAEAILHAAEHSVRELTVGSGGKLASLSEALAPRLTDKLMRSAAIGWQRSGGPLRRRTDNLYGPTGRDGRERAGRHSVVRERSYYTTAAMHPMAAAALVAGAAALGALMIGGGRRLRHRDLGYD
ncbi:SDR family oxidoreductase [Skermanella pratensis]|uniref:SDR family oxidoreductase n=1 Tax=Skermanella pratensis TaxID=2233999 RepID=UPI0013011AD3|nr:SDR family oxidoreductase [Skermanella pratensis]